MTIKKTPTPQQELRLLKKKYKILYEVFYLFHGYIPRRGAGGEAYRWAVRGKGKQRLLEKAYAIIQPELDYQQKLFTEENPTHGTKIDKYR